MNLSKSNREDYILSLIVGIQYFLIILQQCLISILHMEPESTTIYRVILSAIPVIFAFYYILKREALFTLKVYIIALTIILFHSALFPANIEYIKAQAFRFLLPICIPCMLSMRAIRDFKIFKKILVSISWATILLLFVYTISFIQGYFIIDQYNMSFGYGLLLPTLILYNEKTKLSFLAFLFSLFSILSLGSRGPLLVIGSYIVYDVFVNHKKYIPLLFGGIFIFTVSLLTIIQYLDSWGISSRTLELLVSGNINYSSGRENYLIPVLNEALENPILGKGIYGDRVILQGSYCHNFFVELLINWGIPITILLLGVLIFKIIKIYFRIHREARNIFIIFFLTAIFPLLVSNSYLNDNQLFSFLGMILFFQNFYFGKNTAIKSNTCM